MGYLQTTPYLPLQIPSSAPPQLRHHRVPPLPSTSPLLTAMATPSRTRASVTVERSCTKTRSGHASTQLKCFLQLISSVEMKRKPTSEIFGYRQSKTSLNFSSSSVGSTLRSYCCTKGLIHTVLINDVTSSCWKCGSQTSCNGSRVMPPLGNPTHAIKYLSPKEDFIQIAHRVPRPQEPDKALCCPVPILRYPLKNARLHLEFLTHHMTVEMIVFHSCGSRINIFVVFKNMLKREMAQTYVPDLLLDPHHWMEITKSILDFLLVEIRERCTMDLFLYAFESFGIGNKVYPEFSLHCPNWWFLMNSFLTRNVQSDTETILVSPTTLLTGTFGWVSSCSMDTFLRMIVKAPKWEFTSRGSIICSTIWHNNLTLIANGSFYPFMSGLTKVISTFPLSSHMIDTMTSVCLLVSYCNTCVTRTIIRLLEKFANLKWPTDGSFRQEEEVFVVLIRGHIPDPLQIMAESLSLHFQKLISMVLSLAVGTEHPSFSSSGSFRSVCSSFSPNLVEIENFYWMIICPTLQSLHATEHPMLMDNALKIFIAIWYATLETMLLQFSLTLPQFMSVESTVVHSFAINALASSQKSKHNILREQFGSLGPAYFNFHDNEITALLQFNLAISFLSSYFLYVHRWHILFWSLSTSYKLCLLGMFKAAMSYTGTWCFVLIIMLVRHFGVQLDHTIYNHAILGLWTAKSLEQTCPVMYGVLSHFGNVLNIKTCAILFADHSFTIKELLRLAELIQYCVANANLSDASLHTTRMHDYYSINTKVDDTYLQNVSRYKLPIILGLCSVPLYASGSLRPKFFGYFTFLDFLKLVCLWNARRFGNLAFSLRVYAATYPAIKVKIAMIELRSCMVEAQFWPAWFKICVATNFLVVCWEIHTAMVLEASFMILFWNSKAWVNKQRNPLHANLTT